MKENRQSNLVILFTVILFSILIGSSCSSQKDISHSKEIELLRLDSIEYKKPVISTCGYFLPQKTHIIVKSFELLDTDSTIIPAIPIGGDKAIVRRIVYPELAIRAEIQGIVSIEFEIDENGTSKNIRVIKDIGGECAEQAVYAISKTKFIPANILNKNIESRYRISVKFRLVE